MLLRRFPAQVQRIAPRSSAANTLTRRRRVAPAFDCAARRRWEVRQQPNGHQRALSTTAAAVEERAPAPTRRQLWNLALSNAIPFVGFGFADNFLMIVFGDAIDKNIGIQLGFSTMAAAGIGNMLSDVVGIFVGETIEHYSSLFLGTTPVAPLTPAQMQLFSCRMVKGWASCIGIIVGCILGMVPLLFLSDNKKRGAGVHYEEMTLYETCWRPYGVTPHNFFDVMRTAKWREFEKGAVVVQGGQTLDRVLLVASGAVDSYETGDDGGLRPLYRYRSKADIARDDGKTLASKAVGDEATPIRGCFIGGTALLDDKVRDFPYPSTVIAAEKTRIVEWPYEKLREEMGKEKAIEAAMFSILYFDLVEGLRRKHASGQSIVGGDEQLVDGTEEERSQKHALILDTYLTLIEVAVQDGLIHHAERDFISTYSLRHHITAAEHEAALHRCGWTLAQWDVGSQVNTTWDVLDDHERIKKSIPDLLKQSGVKSRMASKPTPTPLDAPIDAAKPPPPPPRPP